MDLNTILDMRLWLLKRLIGPLCLFCLLSGSLSGQDLSDSLSWFVSGLGANYTSVLDRGMSPLIYDGIGLSGVLGIEAHSKQNIHDLRGHFIYGRLTNEYGSRLIRLEGSSQFAYLRKLRQSEGSSRHWSLGAQWITRISSRERVGYSNSARRMDFYSGLGPVLRVTCHPLGWFGPSWTVRAQVSVDLVGMILRPDYATSTPRGFHDDRDKAWDDFWESVQFALPNRWFRVDTELACIYTLSNGNALELRYRWNYLYFDDLPSNRLELAGHYIDFVTKFNF